LPKQIQPMGYSFLSRRHMLAGSGAMIGAAGLGASLPMHEAQAVELSKLLADTGLPVLSVGSDDAKVTIVEYASMTCPHCSRFHNDVYPKLKEKYVDTGKVRFIFREFPLDNLAAAASMLARCSGDGKALPMISVLFSKMDDWAFVRSNPVPALFEIAKQAGFTKESFEKCLQDQALLDKLIKQKDVAAQEFKVSSTPTFFINGEKLQGAPNVENFAAVIDPLLAGG
jgi:protein-disulfide isomerase